MLLRSVLCAAGVVALAASANAADMYRAESGLKDGPAYAANTWTGFYLGANVGGAWGKADLKDINGGMPYGPYSFSPSGLLGGGTAGYNLQRGKFVFGVEADAGYMDLRGSTIIASSDPAYHQDGTLGGGAYGDITGRLGYAFDRTLIYAKGGFAFFNGEGKQATTKPGFAPTGTDTFTGWTVGGGVEHFISPAWSIKAEYLHFDFGTKGSTQVSVTDIPIGYHYNDTFTVTAESVKLGLNYHVGQGYEPLK